MKKFRHIACLSLFLAMSAGMNSAVSAQESAEGFQRQGIDLLKKEGISSVEKALALFDQAIKLNPDYATAYLSAANACLMMFEQKDADQSKWINKGLNYTESLISRAPENPSVYVTKAQLLLDKKSYNQAVLALKKALRIAPSNLEANLTYVGYLLKEKGIDAAYKAAVDSFEPLKQTPLAFKAYAILFLEKKAWEKAETLYLQAMKTGLTNDHDVLAGLADTYQGQKRFKDALHVYENTLSMYPQSRSLPLKIYNAAMSLKDHKKATAMLEKHLTYYPGDLKNLAELASLYEQEGRTTEAGIIREKLKKVKERKK